MRKSGFETEKAFTRLGSELSHLPKEFHKFLFSLRDLPSGLFQFDDVSALGAKKMCIRLNLTDSFLEAMAALRAMQGKQNGLKHPRKGAKIIRLTQPQTPNLK